MKLSDLVVAKLRCLGVKTAFAVTGGASMHLNNSFGENTNLQVVYMHSEQACAMAAEGYARVKNLPAVVIVTSGPGAINTLNGVFGAYTDSIPMFVIAGQPRTETLRATYDLRELRQLGDQEAPMLAMVSHITKRSFQLSKDMSGPEISSKIEELYQVAVTGRPGPVWLEIPVDVQSLQIDVEESHILTNKKAIENTPETTWEELQKVLLLLADSKRPGILMGTGVRLSQVDKKILKIAETLGIPIMTAWTHDTIESNHPNFVGRPGTIGNRPGNLIIQQCDLLLVLGSRLNVRQVSYNWESFAKNAIIIQVDIDKSELQKPFPKIQLGIHSDLAGFVNKLWGACETGKLKRYNEKWLIWCKNIQKEFEIRADHYRIVDDFINVYHLVPFIIDSCTDSAIIVCGDASACIVPFQTARIRSEMRMFSNSGCASMGYDLPAAIGASQATEKEIICFAGDGSLMMNLQELQTMVQLQANIKLFVLDNGGYLSIKQTQENFFGSKHGSDETSGLTFPNFLKIARAFGLEVVDLDPANWRFDVKRALNSAGPVVIVAKLDRAQEFEPRLKSKMIDGMIVTPDIDDMYPFLDPHILAQIRKSALSIAEENN